MSLEWLLFTNSLRALDLLLTDCAVK